MHTSEFLGTDPMRTMVKVALNKQGAIRFLRAQVIHEMLADWLHNNNDI